MSQTSFQVEGMTCNHCSDAVKMALEKLDGVENASVDLESKTAEINYDDSKVGEDRFFEAVRKANYTPVKKN